jgi:hypothetical protein
MLNPHPIHPSAGCYVLKLHRDAAPAEGRLVGRLEHLVSGDYIDFASIDKLLEWLMPHATLALPGACAASASSTL